MARCPFAIWDPIPENETQSRIDPDLFVFHTAVDAKGLTRLVAYFRRSDIHAESTFYIRLDGTLKQMLDTTVRSDATGSANRRAISIECEDDSHGKPYIAPFSDAQVKMLIRLGRWIREAHPKVLPQIPEHSGDAGFGWHSMWGYEDPINLIGPKHNPWTSAFGKTCPGRARIKQLVDVILPAIFEEEDDMFTDEDREMLLRLNGLALAENRWDPLPRLQAADEAIQRIERDVAELKTRKPVTASANEIASKVIAGIKAWFLR
ncbi:MAG: N-acetylmuramoyl-L-alanine amidase [Actinomycetota bacterium]